ncbi:hypothetical protein [Streptomyces sp. ST2-7A]|uniref:hypothetical protein n=1 Tax=Streptomyces sp. ST2-7A TaxID=2907214 RepID=UPI001F3EC429|nr:hypothetical protein [Streptomyces sp. ST2-7A]MCE7079982.1 hypothetical protein [Streptomyces sp. ST2-7A]
MDAAIWLGAASGVIGAATGGGLSIWASIAAQKVQARSNRDLIIAQKIDTAADSAIRILFGIKQHCRGMPLRIGNENPNRGTTWFKSLESQLEKLKVTLLHLRNEELRKRLEKIVDHLGFRDLTEPELGGHPFLIQELCDHALECLGAFVRDERIPEEGGAMMRAQAVEDAYIEIMEAEAEIWEQGNQG